jgi:hypothetical protein
MQAGGGGAWGVLLRPPFPDGSRLDRFDPLAVTYVALENCSSTILQINVSDLVLVPVHCFANSMSVHYLISVLGPVGFLNSKPGSFLN